MYFHYFVIISPWKRVGTYNCKNLEFPSPNKDALCQVWLKLAQRVWRRRFTNFKNVFLLFRYYLPFEKCWALHLKKIESVLPKDALCLVWLKLVKRFWRRRWKYEKFTTTSKTTKTTTDKVWSEKLTWASSSGELKMVFFGLDPF